MAGRTSNPTPSPDGGRMLQPQAAVFLYHQRTGVLSHTHFFSAAPGAELPPRDELERVAYAYAEKDGCNVRQHKALHVDPATLKPGTGYRVSVAKGTLVELKPKRKRLRQPAPRSGRK
jgi:hypothetical protein